MSTANAKAAIEQAARDAVAALAGGIAAQMAAAQAAINDELTNLTHIATRADADQFADVLLGSVADTVTDAEAIWALAHADVVTAVTPKLVAIAALAPIAPASRAEYVLINSKDDAVLSAFAQAAAATPVGNIATNVAFRTALINHMVAKGNDAAQLISAGEAAFLLADPTFVNEVVAKLEDPAGVNAVNLANDVTVRVALATKMNAEAVAASASGGKLTQPYLDLLDKQTLPAAPTSLLYEAARQAVGNAARIGYVEVPKVRSAIIARMLVSGNALTANQEALLVAQLALKDPNGLIQEAKVVALTNARVGAFSYGLANGSGVRDLLAADMAAKDSGTGLDADETALLTTGAAHTPLLRDAVMKAGVAAVKADPTIQRAVFDNANVREQFILEVERQAAAGPVDADYLLAIEKQPALRTALAHYIAVTAAAGNALLTNADIVNLIGAELAPELVAVGGVALTPQVQALLAHPANKPCIEKHIAPAAVAAVATPIDHLIKNTQVGEAIVADMAKVKGAPLSPEQIAVLGAMHALAGDGEADAVINNAKATALAKASIAMSNDATLRPLLVADMQVATLGAGVALSPEQSNLLKANDALTAGVGAIALANPAEVALANDPSVQAWIIADMRSRVGAGFPTAADHAILAAAAGNTLAGAVAKECYLAKDTASDLATYNAGGTDIAALRGGAQAAHMATLQGEIAKTGAQHQVSVDATGNVTLKFKGTEVSAGTGTAEELKKAQIAIERKKK